MKHIGLMALFCLSACGEPAPLTQCRLQPEGALLEAARPRATDHLHFALADKTGLVCASGLTAGQVHEEVFKAECESRPIKLIPSDQPILRLVLESVECRDEDSWDMVPGAFIPGLLPFGPLGFWWFYKDVKVDTPSLTTHVTVEHGGRSLHIDVTVVRAVDTQEDLLRGALSESTRRALEWLYPEVS